MRWWHILCIVVALTLNTVGLGIIYWRLNRPLHMTSATSLSLEAIRLSSAEAMEKLASIQDQLTRLQSPDSNLSVLGATASSVPDQLSDLLPNIPDSTSSISLRYISIAKDFTDPVSVYKEQADFSAVMGQLIPGQKYPFSTNLNNWYQVSLSGGKTGWVKANQVSEIP